MELYHKLAVLVGIVFFIYLVYRVVRLLVAKSTIFILKEDGKFRQEAFVKYDAAHDRYSGYDLTWSSVGQLAAEIQLSEGKAWVRVKAESHNYQDTGYETLGYIDLSGNIYDKDNCLIGYVGNQQGQPDMSGHRKWYELFLRCHAYVYTCARQEQPLSDATGTESVPHGETLPSPQDECVGKCIENGRFQKRNSDMYTTLGRAAAFLLLYQKRRKPETQPEEASAFHSSWSDTALISSCVFAIVYLIFYLFNISQIRMHFFGNSGFFAATLFLFGCIWGLVRQVKTEQSLDGKPVGDFLMLFNRNTGLSQFNKLILILTIIALLVSLTLFGRDFIPLQLALLIGVFINDKYITRQPWSVKDKFRLPEPDEMEDEDMEGMILRSYNWELDSDENTLHGRLDLYFSSDEIEDLRQRNLFLNEDSESFAHNIELLIREQVNERHIRRINQYIAKVSYQADLSELESMQFTLDFVKEPNISYVSDSDIPETANTGYVRFPAETLFAKQGDSDCKAVLAAALFRNAGHKVAYVTADTHTAIAVACPRNWFTGYNMNLLYGSEKQVFTGEDGQLYYLCETTGDTFRIGDYSDSRPEDFNNIHYLI